VVSGGRESSVASRRVACAAVFTASMGAERTNQSGEGWMVGVSPTATSS
jgi:hypothetical protein